MQEVFSKIIEKLENLGWVFADYYPDGTNISRVSKKSVPYDEVVAIVKQAAEQYNNGWIPCSERLPEENSNVIACFAHGLVTELAFYDGLFHGIYEYTTSVIIAWQPLPSPYQPKGE